MVALYGGSAPAQLQRSPGTANPVQGFWAEGSALAGANLTTALPSNVLMEAGGGGAYTVPAALITAILAATEAQDVAAIDVSVGGATVTVALTATEAQDVAAINVAVRNAIALAATEAQDVAAISLSLGAAITMALAATEAQDVATISITVGGGPTEQFTVSGPHVTDIFTTTTLSYPYDIKRRTA